MGIALDTYTAIVHRWSVFVLVIMMSWQVVVFLFFEVAFPLMAFIWSLRHTYRTARFFKALYEVRRTRASA